MKREKLQIYDNETIRTAWDEENEEWYFSIVDVVGVLTESADPPAYWRKLKQRLKEEGNQSVTNCHGLRMLAADGKRRLTDVANTEQLLHLIQFIPSKKTESFKTFRLGTDYHQPFFKEFSRPFELIIFIRKSGND